MALISLGSIGNDITYPLIGAGVGGAAGAVAGSMTKGIPLSATALLGALAGGALGYVIASKTSANAGAPNITLSTASATVDAGSYTPVSVMITGSGFSADSTMYVYWVAGGQKYGIGQTSTGPLGNANITIDFGSFAPAVGSGYIEAQDASTGTFSNQVTLTISQGSGGGTATLTSSVSSISSLPASITLGGSGFDSYANDIYLYAYADGNTNNIIGIQYTSPISCGLQGDFSDVAVTIPSGAASSTISIFAQGYATGTTTNTVTINIVPNPPPPPVASITINPTTVPYAVGNILDITGSGFTISVGGIYANIYVSQYSAGTWSSYLLQDASVVVGQLGNINVPNFPLGSAANTSAFRIYVTDANNVSSNIVTVTVASAPAPTFTVSPTSGTGTTAITFTGTGFTPGGGVELVAGFSGGAYTSTFYATANGQFQIDPTLNTLTNSDADLGIAGFVNVSFLDIATGTWTDIQTITFNGLPSF